MSETWIHVLRNGRLEDRRQVDTIPFRLGSGDENELILGDPAVPEHFGTVALAQDGRLMLEDPRGRPPVPFRPGTRVSVGPFVLSVEDAEQAGATARAVLDRLYEILPRLLSPEEHRKVMPSLLETLQVAFGADWGAFLVQDPESGEYKVANAVGERASGAGEQVSKTVIEQLQGTDEPVLGTQIPGDMNVEDIASIPAEVCSIIAAPLARKDRVAGLIYLESKTARKSFSTGERELLDRVCRMAAEHLASADKARTLTRSNQRLGQLAALQADTAGALARLVGSSKAMKEVKEQIQQVAETDVSAMILGESGTGKELVARAIHDLSPRAAAPFVPVSCAAFPKDLVEDELFGHVKGAFSGAVGSRVGRFEMAHEGTLFLDEFGELDNPVQVKLLRVLQERVIQRLGDNKDIPIDVRLVTATNASLEEAIEEGTFREDLFYRVAVFEIRLPPLRERLEDLPELVDTFRQQFAKRMRKEITGVHPETLEILSAHRWPGNVRELRNVIEQACVRERDGELTPTSLSLRSRGGAAVTAGPAVPDSLEEAKAIFEREHIVRMLREEKGVAVKAAKRLDISRGNLYKKCSLYDLDPASFREG